MTNQFETFVRCQIIYTAWKMYNIKILDIEFNQSDDPEIFLEGIVSGIDDKNINFDKKRFTIYVKYGSLRINIEDVTFKKG